MAIFARARGEMAIFRLGKSKHPEEFARYIAIGRRCPPITAPNANQQPLTHAKEDYHRGF